MAHAAARDMLMNKKKEIAKNIEAPKVATVKHPDGHIYVNRNIAELEAAYGMSKAELIKKGWSFE